jgi:putative zinc finger/helix-turn-helix YgiT family protein
MMNTHVSRCGSCGEKTVAPVQLEKYETTLSHDGRQYALSVPGLDVHRCDSCGDVFLDDDADARVSGALLDAAKLLHPAQIKSERDRLGLMQKDLADLLGISVSTLNRWENGAQTQQRCLDWKMRTLFAVPAARRYADMLRRGDAAAYKVPCEVMIDGGIFEQLMATFLNQEFGERNVKIEAPVATPDQDTAPSTQVDAAERAPSLRMAA